MILKKKKEKKMTIKCEVIKLTRSQLHQILGGMKKQDFIK